MLAGASHQAGRRAARWGVLDASSRTTRCYWRKFHIDDPGHGDWQGNSTEQEPRTIQVRFSCVPESVVDALHGIRAIERRFGRIRDYRLLRDSEVRSEYQAICWAAFESPKSLLHIPQQGATLKVALPPPLGRLEGGPGLDDLKDLFASEDRKKPNPSSSPNESVKPVRSVSLTIKRAGSGITFRSTVKPPHRSRAMKAAIGHGFLEWGGFVPLGPLYDSSPFSSPVQEPPHLDSKNMRMALNKWSQILGVADPLFPEMARLPTNAETRRQGDPGDGWEPLSDPLGRPNVEADVLGEPETSQTTQRSLKQSLESLLQPSQIHTVVGNVDDEVGICPTQEKT